MEIKNRPDVSIIVTVHNAEKYLDECLYSVCSQTYQNIEIICVDGGSIDDSPNILERFARNDQRVKIINDINTSYGHKLNIGFEMAKGSYVGILESDDKLCTDMVENLYYIAKQYKPDVVGGNIFRSFDYKGQKIGYEVQTYQDISYYNRLIIKKIEPIRYAHGAIFASLYKKSFLERKNIKINETPGAAFQDQGFSFLTDILAETVYYINKPVYQYRIDNVESSVYDNKKIFEISWEMQFIESQLRERKITDVNIWKEFWKSKYAMYIHNMYRLSGDGKQQFKERFKSELKNDIATGHFEINILDESQKEVIQSFWRDNEYFEKNVKSTYDEMAKMLCDVLDHILDKPVVVFGAGKRGKFLGAALDNICKYIGEGKINIKCLCDNSVELEGEVIAGKRVLSVKNAVEQFPEAYYVVANTKYYEDMVTQLLRNGIEQSNIYVFK